MQECTVWKTLTLHMLASWILGWLFLSLFLVAFSTSLDNLIVAPYRMFSFVNKWFEVLGGEAIRPRMCGIVEIAEWFVACCMSSNTVFTRITGRSGTPIFISLGWSVLQDWNIRLLLCCGIYNSQLECCFEHVCELIYTRVRTSVLRLFPAEIGKFWSLLLATWFGKGHEIIHTKWWNTMSKK